MNKQQEITNLTPKEAAELLDLHEQTILRFIRTGDLVAEKKNNGRYHIALFDLYGLCELKDYDTHKLDKLNSTVKRKSLWEIAIEENPSLALKQDTK